MKEETLGFRLSRALNDKGITSRRLAELTSLTPSSISYFKQDKRKPRDESLQVIADILEVDFDWLKHGTKLVKVPAREAIEKHSDFIMSEEELLKMQDDKEQCCYDEFLQKINGLLISERAMIHDYFDVFCQIDDAEWFLLNIYTQMNVIGKKKINEFINLTNVKIGNISKSLYKIMQYRNLINMIQKEDWFQRDIEMSNVAKEDISKVEKNAVNKLFEDIVKKIKVIDGATFEKLNERLDAYASMEKEDWEILISYNFLQSEQMVFDEELRMNLSFEQSKLMDYLEDLVMLDKYRK